MTDALTDAQVVEIVFAEIQKAWFQNGSRLERTYALIAALRAAGRLLEPGHVSVPLYRDPSENVEAERLRNVMRNAAAKLHAHNRPALPGRLRMEVRDMLIDGLYATAAATSEEKAGPATCKVCGLHKGNPPRTDACDHSEEKAR